MRFTYKSGQRPLEGYTIKRGVGSGGFGEVYFAVSDDSDPNGVWRFFTLNTEEVISGRQTWADFPGLAGPTFTGVKNLRDVP